MATVSKSFKIPSGNVGVIRSFSYEPVIPANGIAFTPDEINPLIGPLQLSILVDGVGVQGLGLQVLGDTPGASARWPLFLMEQECWIVCPDNSNVTFQFTATVYNRWHVKVYGNLLPTHGLPPDFEIATMGNLGLVPTGAKQVRG